MRQVAEALLSPALARSAAMVLGAGGPDLEGWRGKMYGRGRRGIRDNGEKKARGEGEERIHKRWEKEAKGRLCGEEGIAAWRQRAPRR